MSPIQPSKRRRLNTATTTLSQPFKSPLKTLSNPKSPAAAISPPPTNEAPPSSVPLSPSSPTNFDNQATQTPTSYSKPAPTSTPLRSQSNHTHILALQSQHTRLLSRLAAARAALETSSQALKLESGNREGELEALIVRWKRKSREAAEEVFAVARDRVNRCGGVGGLREKEKERRGKGWGWGWDEGGMDKRGDEKEEDEEGGRSARDDVEGVDGREEGAEGRNGDDEGCGVNDDDDDDEERGYTMDMMFKSLGIDLRIIGFDGALQRWVD